MYCSKSMLAGPREFQATTLAFQAIAQFYIIAVCKQEIT